MKRILFYYNNFCNSTSKGGTEVATFRIARALKATGECEIFHAYQRSYGSSGDAIYSRTIKLPETKNSFIKELKDFILDNNIDVVVVMGKFFKYDRIEKAISESGRTVKLIFMHHFAPGSEKKKTTWKAASRLLSLNPFNPVYYLRFLFYPLVKLPRTLVWPKVYRKIYNASDNVVLLSEGYKEDYCRVGGFSDESKFRAIQNIFDPSENGRNREDISLNTKEKRVLILSRMDEIQKRISIALKIWSRIEKNPALADWHLDIVGDGHNIDIFKRIARRLKLRNVTFHGWQPNKSFLEECSILMSTSDYEGLSLAMIEAQANGCVPIAFNSYASLPDIITDGFNGVIVESPDNIEEFSRKLERLMEEKEDRERLALNAIKSSDKFSSDKIAEKWLKILT